MVSGLVKVTGMSVREIVYDISIANATLLGASIPVPDFWDDDGEGKKKGGKGGDYIDGDDPNNRDAVLSFINSIK